MAGDLKSNIKIEKAVLEELYYLCKVNNNQ